MLTGNQRYVVSIFVTILIVLGTYNIGYTEVTPVSERTSQVRDAIVAEVPGVDAAADVTETHLGAITSLNLRAKSISTLNSGDFSGLTGLTSLNLYGNELSSLPDGIFEGLTALTTLRLGGNTVDPMPITVSLEKVADGQFKAVVPTGALFDIVLPISATNGTIASGVTTITIAKGSTESNIATMSRTVDTTAAVTANIGTLPSLPLNHYGYVFTKSNVLPLEILSAVTTTPPPVEPPIEPPPVEPPIEPPVDPPTTNTKPVFTDGTVAIRSIAENAAAGTNIGTAVSATDANEGDTLTYTLGGINATSFEIDSTNGQLKTKNELDYEMKRVYSITISVSDGSLTDTITVIVSVIDVDDTPFVSTILAVSDRTPQVRDAIVTALPGISSANEVTDAHLAAITSLNLRSAGITELKSGDFSGMTGLTGLNLYGNMLNTLPMGIFEGLSSLNSLRLGGNLIDPLPLIVSVQQMDVSKFRAVVHTGAPFDIVLPIGAMMVTIPKGSLTSAAFTALSTPNINALPRLPANHFGYVLAKSTVCNRTIQVSDAIVNALQGIDDCRNVSDVHLATITSLNLSNMSLTSLLSDDFSGLLSLTSINLSNNQLESLPDSIFDGLTSLSTLDLRGNSVDPLPLLVSLKKVGINQFRVVLPSGAPSDIMLPISVVNGRIVGNVTHIMIPAGSIESQPHTVLRVSDTLAAVSVDIGSTPSLPAGHTGYVFAKSNELPLEIFSGLNVAPVFTEGATTTRIIAENTTASTNIGSAISATDADDDILTYSLSGTDASSFSIDSSAGQLRTSAPLDYETKTSYSVIITVSDGKGGSDSISVTINITDVDEALPNNAPVFTDGDSTTRSIAEDTGSGVDIGSAVSATDVDDDVLTYSLSGTDASSFSINSTNGQLRTSAALDYETDTSYSVTIAVSDGKGGSDSISVTINITDVDEALPNNAPVFTDGDSTTRSVAENTGSGVDIGAAVSATDADSDTLDYSLSGTDAAAFTIDSTTGQLRTNVLIDFETKSSYTVTVTASDGTDEETITVTINVIDTTENRAPVFTAGSSTTRSISEDTGSGVDIGSAISATDADNDTLTYTLSDTDASTFSIDSTNGQLRTDSFLDYETKSSYTVIITVSDGTLTDTITVTINITDVAETPTNSEPVFDEGSSTSRSVLENTNSGVDIGSAVSATDDDNGTLSYSLGGTDAASFSINSTNGQLRTSAALDYETKTSYSVTITVSDGTLTDTIIVTINITDVAETPTNSEPVFDEGSSTSRSVLENTNSGVDIGSAVSATDDDDGTLSYSLGGTDAASFRIDSSSGQISTSSLLNYESKDSYSVTITVSDGSLTSNIDVTIDVIDGNDAPEFSAGSSTSRIVAEDAAISANVGTAVSATDEDGDNLTYSLSGTDAAAFSIDNTTGQLKSGITFNTTTKTTYSVIVTASDGNLTDTITVTITIRSVNDAPVFTEGNSTTRAIAENNAVNANIGAAVSATDADNDSVTYTLGGTDVAAFSIVSTSGQLRANAPLNYETKNSYSVTITASDGNLTDTITITINVTNANDAPVFSDGASTTRAIAENTGDGLNIGAAVSATDEDEDNLTYTLGGTDAAAFDIGSTTGQLQTKSPLDFEDKNQYTVTVAVSDENGGTDTITVTINVTDLEETPANNPPVFTDGNSTTRSVAENSASDTNIGTPVAATDADNNTLAYLLGGTDAASFAIDSGTGQLKTNAPIDHEDKDEYTVTVNVNDGSTTVTITVTINVTDANDAPIFTDGTSTTRSVAENTATGVDIGGAIPATDQDGDELTYTLGGTDASSFGIVSTSGQLQTNAALNYENKGSYAVTITVSDGTLKDTIDVTINVTDANDVPIFTEGDSTTRSVAENTSANTNIGTAVAATDPDADDLTYTLGGTDASSFSIVSTSGQLQTSASLDFETKTSYAVTISVSDGNGGTDSISVTINVTDTNENRSPVFTDGTNTSRSVAENTASGQDIGSPVTATDPDNDDLTYTLGGTDAASFSILNTSGQLQTKSALDFESKSSYSVTITVSDTKLTDSITVTINVTDVDENRAPAFTDGTSTTRSIAENTGSGQNIGTAVAATDPDTGDTLTYTLGGTDASSFGINSTNGQLRTSAALDYETKTSYSVRITVTDTKLTDTINVTINVTDVDENRAPTFTEGPSTTRSIAENTGAGVNIGNAVSATDADNGDTLTYTLGGTDASSFSINSTNGQLRTNAALDYETKTSYSVTITVSDTKLTDNISVTINVTNVQENRAPSFTDGSSTSRSIAENTGSGVNIGSAVSATDPDNGDTLNYTLGGTDAASFSINGTNGQLRTNAALDYETKNSYSVRITVSDGTLTDSINVTINITDVDENRAPSFTEGSSTTRSVAENTGSGVNIGSAVAATDDDNDVLTYTLGGTDASSFSIVSTSGQLQTSAALDYETKSSYRVIVSVSDGNDGSDTITVTINVLDVDENRDPVFTSSTNFSYTIDISTATAGDNIGDALTATDPDGDMLTFSVGGDDASYFRISSDNSNATRSGQLQITQALIDDTESDYSIKVIAADGKGGTAEILGMVTASNRISTQTTNNRPVFTDGSSTTRSVAENTAAGENIGDPVGATDADSGDILTYLLGGTDAASFSIISTSGQLQTSSALDFETKASYTVTVSVSDGEGGSDSITVTINVTDVTETTITPVNERTQQVQDAIVAAAGVASAADVTAAHLAAITTLDLSAKGITSLAASDFDGLTNLTTLILNNNDIRNISALAGLTNLTTLNLHNNNSISNISALAGLTNLTTLDLSSNWISDISPLAGLTKLTTLILNNNVIFELTSLSGLTNLTKLNLHFNRISSISALAGLTKLTTLILSYSQTLFDISPLSGLTNLTTLYLHNNDRLIDISPLSSLTNLTTLYLRTNKISDISSLSGLTNLTTLHLHKNRITDVSPLSGLTNLTTLDLSYNFNLRNISPLESLINLTVLNLIHSSKIDYGPLRRLIAAIEAAGGTLTLDITIPEETENRSPTFVSTTDFSYTIDISTATVGDNIGDALTATDPDGDMLTFSVGGDDASYFSISSDNSNPTRSGQLQVTQDLIDHTRMNYSINVIADDGKGGTAEIAGTVTASNRISTQTANNRPVFTDGSSTTRSVAENTAAGVNIGNPVGATDTDNDTLTYTLSGTDAASFDIDSTTGQLETKTALDYETKTTYTVVVTATDDSGVASTNSANITVTINVTDATETPPTTPLNERTPRVKRVIVALITTAIEGVDSADDVTAEHLASITFLDLYNPGIQTIYSLKPSDFDGLTALTRLDLGNNSLNNTSALSGLTNLTHLNLERNTLDDISALSGLTNLTSLDLSSNEISVISALSGLTNLTHLNLTLNSIIDISSLSGLTNLTSLDLRDNSIGDISSLSGLTNLTSLDLSSNEISVISALSGLTNLKDLDLSFNSISDISSLSGLTNLTSLDLLYNSLSDISSLSGLTNLKTLDLSGNSLSDISSLSGLTNLTSLDLSSNSLSDISALSGLTNLTYLNLPSNSISNISSLSGLTNLTALSLNNNSIIDISSLSGLTNLKTLYLINNSIIDTAVLEDLTSLRTLVLSGNSISDYGPLRRLIAAIKADGYSLFFDINIPPLFTEGTSTTRSIAENTPAGTNIGTAISATDANDYDTLTYSLSGTDAASFAIEETTGQLQTKAVLNFDTKSSYTVIVSVSDEEDGSDSIDVTINVTANGNAPTETSPPKMALLANFPNPFNPETWIPYQLSKSADVTLTIYNMRGVVVRQLELGQKPAGAYLSRSDAIHWDGRNSIGEKVATGVYFYTLKAGDFTATRKMLIRK